MVTVLPLKRLISGSVPAVFPATMVFPRLTLAVLKVTSHPPAVAEFLVIVTLRNILPGEKSLKHNPPPLFAAIFPEKVELVIVIGTCVKMPPQLPSEMLAEKVELRI